MLPHVPDLTACADSPLRCAVTGAGAVQHGVGAGDAGAPARRRTAGQADHARCRHHRHLSSAGDEQHAVRSAAVACRTVACRYMRCNCSHLQ